MLTTSLGLRIGSFGTSTYLNKLCPDKLGFDLRLSIFQEHSQDFAEVCVQLIKRLCLRVRTGKTGDEADEEAGFGRPFDDCGVRLHAGETNTCRGLRILEAGRAFGQLRGIGQESPDLVARSVDGHAVATERIHILVPDVGRIERPVVSRMPEGQAPLLCAADIPRRSPTRLESSSSSGQLMDSP